MDFPEYDKRTTEQMFSELTKGQDLHHPSVSPEKLAAMVVQPISQIGLAEDESLVELQQALLHIMDLISAAFAAFEQRMQSDQNSILMERINLDDLLPGEDSMQRLDLIADPYASEPEKIMEEEENRKKLYKGLRRISEWMQVYLLYHFGFEDDMEHPLVGIALHFHLSESRARTSEALALDNL